MYTPKIHFFAKSISQVKKQSLTTYKGDTKNRRQGFLLFIFIEFFSFDERLLKQTSKCRNRAIEEVDYVMF